MQYVNTRELSDTLRRNGFKTAAGKVKDFTRRAQPQHIAAKLDQWKNWEAADGWPWPQWDRVSEKDWHAIREQCEW